METRYKESVDEMIAEVVEGKDPKSVIEDTVSIKTKCNQKSQSGPGCKFFTPAKSGWGWCHIDTSKDTTRVFDNDSCSRGIPRKK